MNKKFETFKEKALDFAKRNTLWLALGCVSLFLLSGSSATLNTLLLLVLIESIALALSSVAAFAYTKIDFSRYAMWNTLGSIFLGVHICIGLVVMGVYFTQF